MDRSKIIRRDADAGIAAAVRHMPRPAPSTRTSAPPAPAAAPSRAAIARWMRAHADEHRDARTGEVNLTSLVEAWDRSCADGGATLDEDHPAWEIAAQVAS